MVPADERSIKLGDASLAAPFTAKQPSVTCVLDIIRQGRASMGMVQRQAQYGIFYSLSSLLYRGMRAFYDLKWAGPHRMVLNFLSTLADQGVNQLLPLHEISPARLPSSILHPSSIFSVVGQAILHTAVAVLGFRIVSPFVAPKSETQGEKASGSREFVPNAFSNVLFFTSLVEAASTEMVMIKGQPFSTGILDNQLLLFGLVGMAYIPFLCALELDSVIMRRLQLISIPCYTARLQLAALLVFQLLAPWVWDRLMVRAFSPDVYKALNSAPRKNPVSPVLKCLWGCALLQWIGRIMSQAPPSCYE